MAENAATTSVDAALKPRVAAKNAAGSRTKFGVRDAGAASLRFIEQLFPQPACLRSGQEPEALQQHEVRAVVETSASDGSIIAAIRNAAKNLGKAADYRLIKTTG